MNQEEKASKNCLSLQLCYMDVTYVHMYGQVAVSHSKKRINLPHFAFSRGCILIADIYTLLYTTIVLLHTPMAISIL